MPERTCKKCGGADISVTYRPPIYDPRYFERPKHHVPPAEEHLDCKCRTCGFTVSPEAALAAIESQPSGWQDIATAPKDQHILGIDMMWTIAEYAWISQHRRWIPDVLGAGEPTHWMPLPAPPEARP